MGKCNGLAVLKETCKREIGLAGKRNKKKDTIDLNSFYNFYQMKFIKKTNRLAAQKDQENI